MRVGHPCTMDSFLLYIAGGTDISSWKDYGSDTDIYIKGLTLTVSNETAHYPVYYVSLKAINGAGQESDPVISSPIMVVDEDEPGKKS